MRIFTVFVVWIEKSVARLRLAISTNQYVTNLFFYAGSFQFFALVY